MSCVSCSGSTGPALIDCGIMAWFDDEWKKDLGLNPAISHKHQTSASAAIARSSLEPVEAWAPPAPSLSPRLTRQSRSPHGGSIKRSEDRSVGKGGGSTGRYRWSPSP